MRSVALGSLLALALGACAQDPDTGSSSSALTPVVADCAVEGHGAFLTGESFDGAASTIGTIFTVDWEHSGPGANFTTTTADGVNCFLNGGIIAVVDGFGTGTLNGTNGYYYSIFAEDRRDPATPAVTLTASRTTHPTRFHDGTVTFSTPTTVTIPESIPVTAGAPGNGWARLYLDGVRCDYRGNGHGGRHGSGGDAYEFDRCSGSCRGGASSLHAGSTLDVTSARLRIQTPGGCRGGDDITAEATIAPGVPSVGSPDIYSVTVFDAGGTIVYDFGANLNDGEGDIVVEFL